MSQDIVVSITLFGKAADDKQSWERWCQDANSIFGQLGQNLSHLSINSQSLNSGKVMKAKRAEKKVFQAIDNNESIKWINFFSLPDDFQSASFDYTILLVRTSKYVSLILDETLYEKAYSQELVNNLKEHIKMNSLEIYSMERDESPLLYAAIANGSSSFNSFKLIKRIEV